MYWVGTKLKLSKEINYGKLFFTWAVVSNRLIFQKLFWYTNWVSIVCRVDIKVTEYALTFDIACVGLDKKDITLDVTDNTLRVIYEKPNIESNPSDEDAGEYIHRGITRKSFNMGWKIAPRYDLSQIEAVMKNGLLSITIPLFEEAKPKTIKIK